MRRLLLALVCLALLIPVPEAAAATVQVHMSGYAYGPAQVTVRMGDTVTWTNHDQAPHDAVVTSGPAQFRSPLLSTGQSWSFTFSQPGTYSYYCSVHPDMRAQVVVQPAPTTQAAPPPPPQPTVKRTTPARPAATSVAVVAPPPPAVTTTTEEPVEVVQQPAVAAPPQERPTLDPLLLVAGLVAGVATLCLLLIGSRSAAS